MPVDGSPIDQEMVDHACYLAKRSHARLYAVYVIEVRRTMPLEVDLPAEVERGEKALQRADEIARKWRQEIETEVLQARDAGTAIVEEAERRRIDLIIMGIPYKKRFDQFCMGCTVTYVLKNAPCMVYVCREPMAQTSGADVRQQPGD